MKLKEAYKLFDEIIELCYQMENQQLIIFIESIATELEEASDVSDIITLAEEMQVIMNDIDFLDEEEENSQEIIELIERFFE
jgi:hypothetical protein